MKKDKQQSWFAPAELLGIGGLPKSPQGLNKRAREDGWEKRRRKGVQGRGVEYAFESLPEPVRHALLMQEQASPEYRVEKEPDPLAVWVQVFQQCSQQEQEQLVNFILREGLVAMLARLGLAPDTLA
ncbi:putative DNA-binding transcriptional regulator [Affinibrenneria salicis]|uniref:Putative DNA-binding transcriptional regulator n=1 Tax=Affinibrenneria salicis TaxID=2590031 RepID=A0A5J5G6Z0_9GAMM|nr:DNA-binding protein [Affinibrenneria salicis]KAA9002764.1 putative DNA-binding transcriptional regulator [Affinibrenneria salicis]KAA9002949.1 putative DNA-binding transcriptional regulator [Affinibrenneria salicis]